MLLYPTTLASQPTIYETYQGGGGRITEDELWNFDSRFLTVEIMIASFFTHFRHLTKKVKFWVPYGT
jgi:hypothetical protein